ncbi:MAG: Tetratricopeptide 2 repeat protein, partial [Chthoniobacteraceae bacterium]|nr:Tetratricopeptide 2 repeat protein [Chthoniobacteraceae bacterium]
EGDASSKVEGSAAEQMRKAEKFEADNDPKSALAAYRALVKRYGLSVIAPKAQHKIGVLLERAGEYDEAYKAYEIYLTKYPRGEDFESVVDSMYKIAKLFLDGEKKKLLGVRVSSSMSRAQEMFEGIVKKAPFNKIAPLAQFNIGQALEKQSKFPEALVAYQTVISRYPTDAIADDAQYQIGYVRLREYREGSNDRASAQKAREAFEDFISRYPQSEKVPQAQENLKTLEGGSAKSTLEIAKFYDKTKSYKAAVIYYNDVIKSQPDTPESAFAKNRIAELKSKVGEDALKAGPERAETGARAQSRRKLEAKVNTTSRPDYVGPPVVVPVEPDEVAPPVRPKMRTSPQNIGPVPPSVEPALPEALPQDPELPKPPQ